MPEPDLIELFAMLAISGEELDRAALHDWIARLGLELDWRKATG